MWFDTRAKLAEIAGQTAAKPANLANLKSDKGAEIAKFAEFATPPGSKSETAPTVRADGLDLDTGAYLDRLRLHGPATYGAMASALGWGATRAWKAEAKLRASGLIHYDNGKGATTLPPALVTIWLRRSKTTFAPGMGSSPRSAMLPERVHFAMALNPRRHRAGSGSVA
jgi:hypothetical protein